MYKSAKLMIAGALLSITVATPAVADFSANIGLLSDYFYRGVVQNTTATTNGGLDYEQNGFYLGTWAADVEDGLEVDIFGGYGFEFDGGFSVGVGFTGYYYTGDFDDTYQEINLTAGYSIISFEYSFGEYDNFGGPDLDYDFTAVTIEKSGFYGKYGTFGDDFDGDYFEFGYGTEIGGFDTGISIVINDKNLDLETGDGTETIIFSISKSFDL
ncbi:MAG: TorF family putative porin [Gammaproteobacteria bacterium]|nr:TorF family putative porin [Gammaproteobacteria bacterium]